MNLEWMQKLRTNTFTDRNRITHLGYEHIKGRSELNATGVKKKKKEKKGQKHRLNISYHHLPQ